MIGIDHEYIPANAAQGNKPSGRPNVEQIYCEVMQMGACKLDTRGNEIGVLNLTVQAHRIPVIPTWLTRLTGMTAEKRALGIQFPEALAQLVAFVGDDTDVWTFNGDWWVLKGNAEAHQIAPPFPPFKRLKPLLLQYGITKSDFEAVGAQEICSGDLYRVLRIELPAIQGVGTHDAAHDARSLAHSIYHLTHK